MAHNIVYLSETDGWFKQFSTAELDELAERVLRIMASGTYTGTITVGTSNSIGTFTDTYYTAAAGQDSDANPPSSTTYTLSQVATQTLGASSDPPMYVGLDTSTPNKIVLKENMTTKEQLADEILSRMVSGTGGTNAYYLAASAPADGATWVSRGTLLDTKTNGTVTITDYKLWQRTTSGATIVSKNPLKITNDPLKSFDQSDLLSLIKLIENKIISTGIGTYVLQETVPATGTWTNVGTVTDTIEQTAFSSYNSDFYPYTNLTLYNTSYTTSYFGILPNSMFYTGPIPGFTYYYGRRPDGDNYFAPFGTYLGPSSIEYNFIGPPTGSQNFIGPTYEYPFDTNYDTDYEGPIDYLGPSDYNKNTIESTTTVVTTRTLWRRIA